MATLQQLNQSGTMDKNEYDRLVDQLPDPSSWSGLFASNENAEAAYRGVAERIRQLHEQTNQKYAIPGQGLLRNNLGTPATLPPGFTPVN